VFERLSNGVFEWVKPPCVGSPFGYKISWLVVQGFTTEEVSKVLAQSDARYAKTDFLPCNWASGIGRIRSTFLNREVFISPPVQGWVFVVNWQPNDDTEPDLKEVLEALSTRGRAGFFASHRVASYASWALAENGNLFRHLSEADGETFRDLGPISDFERADMMTSTELTEAEISEADEDDYYDRLPDESDVIEVAGKFSLDPIQLDGVSTVGLGLIGRPR
jgi:hypothetical protein